MINSNLHEVKRETFYDKFIKNYRFREPEYFEVGELIYWVKRTYNQYANKPYYIDYGIVQAVYKDSLWVSHIVPKVIRTVDDVPVEDIWFPTKRKKLPKGWSYQDTLFKFDTFYPEEVSERIKGLTIDMKEEMEQAYRDGILVDVSGYDNCEFRQDIDPKEGWCVFAKYLDRTDIGYLSEEETVNRIDAFKNFKDVKERLDLLLAEYDHQANMSDYDWAVNEMDTALNQCCKFHNVDDRVKNKVREFLLGLDDIENIDFHYGGNGLRYRHVNWKKWRTVDFNTFESEIQLEDLIAEDKKKETKENG